MNYALAAVLLSLLLCLQSAFAGDDFAVEEISDDIQEEEATETSAAADEEAVSWTWEDSEIAPAAAPAAEDEAPTFEPTVEPASADSETMLAAGTLEFDMATIEMLSDTPKDSSYLAKRNK